MKKLIVFFKASEKRFIKSVKWERFVFDDGRMYVSCPDCEATAWIFHIKITITWPLEMNEDMSQVTWTKRKNAAHILWTAMKNGNDVMTK